jgi:chaperonin GroEL
MAEGIVAGGGVALLHAAPVLEGLDVEDYAIGVEIVRRALSEPTYLIAANAGFEGHEVLAQVANLGVDDGFDALEGRYGNMIEMGIIDPLRVCRSALENGAPWRGCSLPRTRSSPRSRRRGAVAEP